MTDEECWRLYRRQLVTIKAAAVNKQIAATLDYLDKLDTLERILMKSEAVRGRVKRDADLAIALAQR